MPPRACRRPRTSKDDERRVVLLVGRLALDAIGLLGMNCVTGGLMGRGAAAEVGDEGEHGKREPRRMACR